ncbi:Aspartate aminotransferase, cytoplasmic [Venturia inaequalis]|nr:Aspartate aminotransferase, cytoplasmic [Venturia inaequalis]
MQLDLLFVPVRTASTIQRHSSQAIQFAPIQSTSQSRKECNASAETGARILDDGMYKMSRYVKYVAHKKGNELARIQTAS